MDQFTVTLGSNLLYVTHVDETFIPESIVDTSNEYHGSKSVIYHQIDIYLSDDTQLNIMNNPLNTGELFESITISHPLVTLSINNQIELSGIHTRDDGVIIISIHVLDQTIRDKAA